MTTHRWTAVVFLAALLAPGWGTPRALAEKAYVEEEDKPRTWLFWNKPEKETPELQLAYAQGLEKRGRIRSAAKEYRRLAVYWPGSPEAPQAQLQYATLQYRRGKLAKSFKAYQKLIETYPNHAAYEDLLDRQFQIARELMEARHATFGFLPGFTQPKDALEPLQTIVKNGPRWERAAEAQYLIGWIHEDANDLDLAVVEYMNTMVRHPESPFAEQAAFNRCRCLLRLAEQNRYDMDQWQEAWYAMNLYLATYPDSERASVVSGQMKETFTRMARAAYDIALFYDEKTTNANAALIAYRSFAERYPTSEWTPHAKERIDALSTEVEVNPGE